MRKDDFVQRIDKVKDGWGPQGYLTWSPGLVYMNLAGSVQASLGAVAPSSAGASLHQSLDAAWTGASLHQSLGVLLSLCRKRWGDCSCLSSWHWLQWPLLHGLTMAVWFRSALQSETVAHCAALQCALQ